ncbi:BTB/POZ domain-containing protein [Platanthera zijinensis]|uniref:BTB/POZ domain-containing protein n=1 Tax=Platanthera zijinensis TaxID=2320716 RepID=A0AAP0BI22_9ASPA
MEDLARTYKVCKCEELQKILQKESIHQNVTKIREYCLDTMACNFEAFAETWEFRAMLLMLPPPFGDSSLRSNHPSAPGSMCFSNQGNHLDDLREKWFEAVGADLDKRFPRRVCRAVLCGCAQVSPSSTWIFG